MITKDLTIHVAPGELLDSTKYDGERFKNIFCVQRVVRVCILDAENLEGTLKQSKVYPGLIRYFKDVELNIVTRCIIENITAEGLFLRFFNSKLRGLCHCSKIEDKKLNLKEMKKRFQLKQVVVAKVVYIDAKKFRIFFSMKPSDLGDYDLNLEEDENVFIDVWKMALRRKEKEKMYEKGNIKTEIKNEDEEVNEDQMIEEEIAVDWNDDEKEQKEKKEDEMSEEEEDDDEEDDSDEEENDEDDDNEMSEDNENEEEGNEENGMEEESEEEEQYDLEECQKAVETDRDNSLEWIKLMKCFIQRGEIEQARKTAQKAIEIINFRKLEEKLNVWKALMLIEAKHGTDKSLQTVYNNALQVCERKDIMLHMCKIYKQRNDAENEEKVFRGLFKKVKGSCKVYKKYCNFLMRTSREEEIKMTIGKAKTSLDKKKMIKLQLYVARIQYKYGSVDKGRSMFEEIVENNPKRLDIWNIYIDMEQQVGDVTVIRRLFERVVKMKLSTKTMKTFLTKYLEFERVNGDENRMEHVREIAKSFVESK